MPLFEFICKDCGKPFEKIVPRYDSEVDCKHCNSVNVEKQLSVFAVAGSSSSSSAGDFAADAGCGRCGAAQPGMCGMTD
jgi:putative FmdB family regulatory protein